MHAHIDLRQKGIPKSIMSIGGLRVDIIEAEVHATS